MKRAQFIKTSCSACAAIALSGLSSMVFTGCASLPIYRFTPDETKICKIDTSQFTSSNMLLIRVKNFEFDLVLIKKSETVYSTLELKCTHENQPLTMSNKNIFCNAHGSVFDLDGKAIKQPATLPLKSFKTNLINNEVHINLS